jgi:glycosyltransferase involved in cell wall biosynthesis
MAHGVPVIAFKSGGITEPVIQYRTGVFFKEYSVRSLVQAIKKFESTTISVADCRKQAEFFSEDTFITQLKHIVSQLLPDTKYD